MKPRRTSLVSGRRLVSFEIAERDDLYVDVVVHEGDHSWKFLEPGWRGLSFGADGSFIWWWSARSLGVMPTTGETEVDLVQVDGDEIAFVFRVDDLWLLVCELTLRLRDDVQELARWDFPDVVLDARWDDDVLVLNIAGSPEARMLVRDRRLMAEASLKPSP